MQMVIRLKEAGFTDTQAEVVTDIVRDSRDADLESLVTKGFMKSEMAEFLAEIRTDLSNFKTDLFKWLLPLMIGQVALTAALVKLL